MVSHEVPDKLLITNSKISLFSYFQNTLEDLNIPRIMIDASRKPKVVFYSLCQQLRSITDFRESLFSQCLAVRARQANEMLAKGYKQSSRFGRWDPVEVNFCQRYQTISRNRSDIIILSLAGTGLNRFSKNRVDV